MQSKDHFQEHGGRLLSISVTVVFYPQSSREWLELWDDSP